MGFVFRYIQFEIPMTYPSRDIKQATVYESILKKEVRLGLKFRSYQHSY